MNSTFLYKIQSSIAKKLLITILISSSIITFILITIQLSLEYRAEVDNINTNMNQIENSYTKSLALSIWTYNKDQYEIQLEGILNIENIVYVKILTLENREVISKGLLPKDGKIIKTFELKTKLFNEEIISGKLIVVASLQKVYDELLNRVAIILVSQGVKTLIISFIILFAFHILVTRYLYKISEYTKNINFCDNENLILNKSYHNDELDNIVTTLNDMKKREQKSKKELELLNETLELKVKERTEELNQKNILLEKLSTTDALTGLNNRLKLDEIFAKEIERSRRYKHSLSIILCDIDKFKYINDTYGHQVGDLVLIDFAKLIQESLRKADTAGRWGGEEFLIICPETDIEGAENLAEKLRQTIEKHHFPKVGQKTASFGVTELKNSENEHTIMERVDEALYRAKDSGRNRVEVNI